MASTGDEFSNLTGAAPSTLEEMVRALLVRSDETQRTLQQFGARLDAVEREAASRPLPSSPGQSEAGAVTPRVPARKPSNVAKTRDRNPTKDTTRTTPSPAPHTTNAAGTTSETGVHYAGPIEMNS